MARVVEHIESRTAAALRKEPPQVRATTGLHNVVRQIAAGSFEGNPKWLTISRSQDVPNYGAQ